jgi:hypothetical protein
MPVPPLGGNLVRLEAGVLASKALVLSHSSGAAPDSHRTCSPFEPKLTPGTSVAIILFLKSRLFYL